MVHKIKINYRNSWNVWVGL